MTFRYIVLLATLLSGCLNLNDGAPPPPPDVNPLGRATSSFAQTLYDELAAKQVGAIYSPFSAHAVLSLTYMGARGTTAGEMKSALQLSNVQDPHATYRVLITSLNSALNIKLLTANGMWIHPDFQVLQQFKDDAATNYFAKAENIEFAAQGGPEAPINEWVANKTENKIKDLLPPGTLTPDTSIVLVNTIFFNSTWKKQFLEYNTKRVNFYKANGKTAPVELMNQVDDLDVKESALENSDLLRIPFTNERFSFYVLLPKSASGLEAVEKKFIGNNFDVNGLFAGLTRRRVDVSLPKFNLTATMKLNEALKKLGMSEAFSSSANFSGISNSSIMISDVIQKAVIEVRETGTVAAAATAVIAVRTSAVIQRETPFVFKADHPFIFWIRDDTTGTVLFQGKFADPAVKEININTVRIKYGAHQEGRASIFNITFLTIGKEPDKNLELPFMNMILGFVVIL
ncbi:unnamed protein product [Lymnaea stagnalis]|uniref:Serpin domain-containing protein n=1 Tax=Lymnaea stagnalis TaxID=6523 RepID=A0AAV2I0Y1_LYMST